MRRSSIIKILVLSVLVNVLFTGCVALTFDKNKNGYITEPLDNGLEYEESILGE